MENLTLLETDFFKLVLTDKGQFKRIDKVLNDEMVLTDLQAKGMLLIHLTSLTDEA